MDRKYIIILGLCVVGLFITGVLLLKTCNKKPEASELTIVTYNEDKQNLKDYISAFEAANNTKINFVNLDSSNYELDSLNMISTGKMDIWGIPNSWLPKQHNKLAPLSGKLSATYDSLYPKVVATENVLNDKIYGVPLALDPLVLYVNSEVKPKSQNLSEESQAVISKQIANWDDIAAKSQLLTIKQGATITQAGAAFGTEDPTDAPDILTLLMLQYGAQMTDQTNSEATFHTAVNTLGKQSYPGAAALDFYTSFGKSNNPNYSYSKSLGDPLRAFANNKAAFYIDYLSKEKELKRINPELNYQVKALPQVKEASKPINFLSYETFTVPQSSKNQMLAWQFVAGLSLKDNLKTYFDTSKKYPALLSFDTEQGEINSTVINSAQSWYNPEPTKVAQIFRDAISETVAGKSAQTALDGAALEVTSYLTKIK